LVSDTSQAVIPGVTVTAESPTSGKHRSSVTDSGGHYVIANLPVGTYSIVARKPAFRPARLKEIHVGVAETLTVNLTLEPGDVHVEIDVSAIVGRDVAPGVSLRVRQISELPNNGRDYARQSLFSPGAVARSGNMSDLPFNGLSIVLNSYAMDGVDASRVDVPFLTNGAERGARLLTGSLDSIEEFRVQSANYQAQYGRAASAYINIATRSGTNDLHGSLFYYLRNHVFDARNFFNTTPNPQAEFRYGGFGANLSGPIRRNQTLYFGNYEGSRQHIGVTGTGTTPSPLMRSETLSQSPALASILANFPAGTATTSNPLVNLTTRVGVSKVREDTGSFRLDHIFSAADTVFARANRNDSRVRGPLFALQSSALGLMDFQDVPVRTANAALRYQHVFGPHLLNEILLGMQRVAAQYNTATPFGPVSIVGLSILPGGSASQKSTSTSYQVGDDMSYAGGAHCWKWGGTAYRIQNDARTTDFARLTYASPEDFIHNRLSSATYLPGVPGRSVRSYQAGLYAQDTWRTFRTLTLDFGLRFDIFPPVFDPEGLGRPFDTRGQTLAPPGAQYYRGSRANLSPRLAAAWQPASRWTLRWGYGIFYQPYPVGYAALSIPQNSLPGNTTLLRQQVPDLSYPITPFLAQGSIVQPTVTGFDWTRPDTYAQHWSATAAYQASQAVTLQTAYVGNHALNLRRRRNINLFDPVRGRRPHADFADILIESSDAQSLYHGWQSSVTSRWRGGFIFAAHYTWSHAIDDAADDNFVSSQPQDVNNVRAERGNGTQDVRHSASFQAIYELPFGRHRALRGVKDGLRGGWQLAAVGLLRSGIPASVTIPISRTGNGVTLNQRPDAVPGVSPYASPRSLDAWLNPAAFSVPAPGSFGNLGRNTIFGPGLAQIDVSALKNTRLRESAVLQFRAECFNLPNHPAFAQPGAVLGTAGFGKILNTLGRTFGMGTSRQIQLALRLQF